MWKMYKELFLVFTVILAPVLASFFIINFWSPGPTQEKIEKNIYEASVGLSIGRGSCTGGHLGQGYILTAAHCVTAAERFKSDIKIKEFSVDHKAEVLWSNTSYDVALLLVKDYKGVAAELSCRKVDIGEDIVIVGDPFGIQDIHTYGKIAGFSRKVSTWEDVHYLNISAAPGNSGSPIFDKDKKIVGVLVGGYQPFVPMTIGVPSSVVCRIMGVNLDVAPEQRSL